MYLHMLVMPMLDSTSLVPPPLFGWLQDDWTGRDHETRQFAKLLCWMCTATCTEKISRCCNSELSHTDYLHDALHAHPCNQHVDAKQVNLREFAPEEQHEVIKSIDYNKDKHTHVGPISSMINNCRLDTFVLGVLSLSCVRGLRTFRQHQAL